MERGVNKKHTGLFNNNIKGKNMKKIAALFCICLLCLGFNQCKNPTEPVIDPSEPVADAGSNQTINLGSYFILDGTKSTKGNGAKLTYTWTADSGNPENIYVSNDSVLYKVVSTTGTYKYTLVVNNGIRDSKSAEVIIKVNPKSNSVFADPHLEAQIRFLLKKQTGDLTSSDLLSFDSLRIGGDLEYTAKITSLAGIENCKNLRQLLLSNQSITDVSPLSNLTNLLRLDIDQNYKISDVSPLATLNQLKYLDLSDNNISYLNSISNLVNLEFIDIERTSIKDISIITKFTKLKEFWGTNLPITDLSIFSNLKDLELLYLVFSDLRDISAISNLTKLKQIELSVNQISDITPLSNLTGLITLRIAYNNIKDISAVQGLTNLTDIGFGWNQIEDIKPLVDNPGLSSTCYLTVTGNPLNNKSQNDYIPQLRAKGVVIYW
jgi:Leucine-rich repeat (LRR) protein